MRINDKRNSSLRKRMLESRKARLRESEEDIEVQADVQENGEVETELHDNILDLISAAIEANEVSVPEIQDLLANYSDEEENENEEEDLEEDEEMTEEEEEEVLEENRRRRVLEAKKRLAARKAVSSAKTAREKRIEEAKKRIAARKRILEARARLNKKNR